ncbi:DNA internalization-related competence protein ComEC/Rec2 [Anaerosacchariphilus polymeriproducens]|uniref:DNA internalization-related competence protein ComEC/Rec2 n=1 Tax=Anaerosacchariphilus polymeriproducens TaxID=1812858 RepID=UPI001390293A|nr:DNA internalization-related competence protein ComEC/Rec2 [Anaerosacchariphilus polymeriproducens]
MFFVSILMMIWIYYKRNKLPLLLITFLIAGYIRYGQAIELESPLYRMNDNQNVLAAGKIYKTEVKNKKEYLYLNDVQMMVGSRKFPANSILIISNYHVSSHIGNQIKIKGKFKKWKNAKNPGAFNESQYYHTLNIGGKVLLNSYTMIDDTTDYLGEWLKKLRTKTRQTYEKLCTDKDAGVLCAMILGDTTKLEDTTKDIYKDAGIMHILAISGLHISMLGLLCYRLFRRLGIGILSSSVIASFIVSSYGILTGSSISTHRAVLMFLIFMGAQLLGRTFDMFTAVSLTALVMLYGNPFVMFQGAFLLSYGGVIIIAFYQEIEQIRTSDKCEQPEEVKVKKTQRIKKCLDFLTEGIKSSFFIQIGLLPIIANFYYESPRYAVFTNLFVLILAPMILQSGLLGGMVGNVCPYLGRVILQGCSFMIDLVENICKFFRLLPFSQWIIGKPQSWQIFIYYLFFIIFISGIILCKKKVLRFGIFVIFSNILFLIISLHIHSEVEVTILYVGQGDGSYIRGPAGKHYFIDGGSSDLKEVGKNQILPFLKSKGVKQIDYWFISHSDEDHISGLKEVLKDNYHVKCLFLPKMKIDNSKYKELISLAKKAGTKVMYIQKGNILQEKYKEKKMVLKCLYPCIDNLISEESCNENSAVMSLEFFNIKGLFTGDIGFQGEEILLQNKNLLSDCDFLKVAHHGSKNSTSDKFLQVVKPEISLISCGENNSYGHPHKELLSRLSNMKSRSYITYQEGAVTIKIFKSYDNKVKMVVEKFSPH